MSLLDGVKPANEPVEPDDTLVAKALGGDRLAMRLLLLRHHDRLVATIDRRLPADLRGTVAADDICQEAYVSVFLSLESYMPGGGRDFYKWLAAIARRKLVDAIRARHADKRDNALGCGRPRRPAGDWESLSISLLELVAVHERTPSRSAARRELVQAVHHALKELNTDQREALRARYILGLSVAQTAASMDRTDGAVMMLCSRGLRRLAEIVGPEVDSRQGA